MKKINKKRWKKWMKKFTFFDGLMFLFTLLLDLIIGIFIPYAWILIIVVTYLFLFYAVATVLNI